MYILNQASHVTYVKKTTVENEEIVKNKIKELHPEWTHHNARKITVSVKSECLVLINGVDEILITPEYGLSLEYSDIKIETFTTLTENVELYMVISY